MNVSLICACKNRYDALAVSLSSWLRFDEIKEIIIVDWSSDEPLNHLTKLDPRIKIIRVDNQEYFNQPQPLNLAISLASGDYIIKVDTDYIINPYFNFFKAYPIDNDSFISGHHNIKSPEYVDPTNGLSMIDKSDMSIQELADYINSYSHFFKYLTGLLFTTKENFTKIGGYNECLGKYYAFEDDEICKRFNLLGLNHKKINYDHHLIHIPHPDKKRIENFEGFGDYEKSCLELTDLDEDRWNCEYSLSQEHIKKNRELFSTITDYYIKPKTKWNMAQIDDQNYFAEKLLDNKLSGFPSAYYVSLEESNLRREHLEGEFNFYDITPKAIISKRFAESNDIVTGKYLHTLNDGTKGCVVSHLKAIKDWYENTDEDYAFFCEDDLSLETVQYWDFTWEKFIESLPEDAECVQLMTIRGNFDTFELREREWDDWGATAYIITRNYAEQMISKYIHNDTYNLELDNDTQPLIENILFANNGKSYTIPLFVEEIKFESTFVGKDDDVKGGQKNNHYKARELVLNWWKNKTHQEKSKVSKTELEKLLEIYSIDTENPQHNFNLAAWYWNQNHTAPALSYFLRCAERAEDDNLAYEALIWSSYCYDKQGTRDNSAKSFLQQAICLLPNRPEAYFLLSRFCERRQWWQECYIYADQALLNCDFRQEPLKTNVEYPGKYGLLFEKAVSGWWWGKTEESKNLFNKVLNEYDNVDAFYVETIKNNLKLYKDTPPEEKVYEIPKLKNDENFRFKEDFDWGDLTYEDIITIDREIVHEKVYRYWRDVKENDVVMDIGSSVGPFICSILENKPSKVYCIEPSKTLIKTLAKNCAEYLLDYSQNPLSYVNYGIVNEIGDSINIFGSSSEFNGITFKELIDSYSIDTINFLKIDCEGGEYNIFKDENMDFLLNKVEFVAMEVHLNYDNCRKKFKEFRDKYLVQFKDYRVISCTRQQISWGNSIDIKDRIFDDNFIDEYTCEFMIYIYNQH